MGSSDRLTMLDENGSRLAIIPAEASGPLRVWRDRVYIVLLVVFLGLPWIRIDGLQALLLDIPNRRFEVFGHLYLAHDAPLIFFLLASFVLLLAWMTAVYGRIWCGWACPQTVFIDAVYRRIERFVEGTAQQRRILQKAPWTFKKLRLFSFKWLLFLLVSSIFAHSFAAYFVGAKDLIAMVQAPPENNWSYFVFISLITVGTAFNFGWFREQFCVIMCPYGRLQGALMDRFSRTVFYDQQRGEPRRDPNQTAQGNTGDCVACRLCVQVCPTGIDIRDGIQMECIACTACIDACNSIMKKVNKPLGLISYKAEAQPTQWSHRARSFVYATLFCIVFGTFIYQVSHHHPFSITILRAKEAPFQKLENGLILNHFHLHVLNQSHQDQRFQFHLPDHLREMGIEMTQAAQDVKVPPGKTTEVHIFLRLPEKIFGPKGELPIEIESLELDSKQEVKSRATAIGPQSV